MNCPACFKGSYNSVHCLQCGYDSRKLNIGIALPLGTSLKNGEYKIGKVLGKPGGFGITYLGWNVQLETLVAIKEYLPLQIAGRGAGTTTVSVHAEENSEVFEYGLKSFLEEARTLAQLRHESVVRVQNFFRENGTAYMVMEYLEGQSLEEYLAQIGRVTAPDAVALFLPVLDGLAYMHQKNILHRDIKPANIYLTEEGKAILLDFGAARQAVQEKSQSMTAIVTPGYAPWEQYHRKGKQGPWTDVYACAATLYRMVTGQNPPEGAERVLEDDIVPVDRLVPGTDATIAAGIMAGLAVKVEERPQTTGELKKLLCDNHFMQVRKTTHTRQNRNRIAQLDKSSGENHSSRSFTFFSIALAVGFLSVFALFSSSNNKSDSSLSIPAGQAKQQITDSTNQVVQSDASKNNAGLKIEIPEKQDLFPPIPFKTANGKNGVVNLYASPNAYAAVVGTVKENTEWLCKNRKNGFVFIDRSGVKGWVIRENIVSAI